MKPTHYIEQFKQIGKTKLVNGPMQEINSLKKSLALTRSSNCITIAVFKIRFKDNHTGSDNRL